MLKMKLNLQFFASGNKIFDASGYLQGKLEYSAPKDDEGNLSEVTVNLFARRTNSYTTTGKSWNGYITIDGSKSSFSSLSKTTEVSDDWVLMHTFTKSVTHNENGEKTITIAGSITGPSGTSLEDNTSKGSVSVELDKINRASALSEIEDFNLTDSIQIEITKYVDTYVDNLVITSGETVIKTINNIVSGASIEFTATEQELIKSLMTSPKLVLTFTLTTLNETETIGTSIKTAKVSSFDRPILYNVNKKENGHYQFSINGLIDEEIDSPLQIYNDEGKEILNEVVLYDNEAGSSTTITLKETSANFKYLEFFCQSSDNTYTSVKVYKPNGKRVSVVSGWFGIYAYFKNAILIINGTTVSVTQHNACQITGSAKCSTESVTTAISVIRVVGYR